jgi:hypothetical protein
MGAWQEQAKRTTQYRKLWSEAQQFGFIHALQNATNEEEVKAAYIREFSLPVKMQERHKYQWGGNFCPSSPDPKLAVETYRFYPDSV